MKYATFRTRPTSVRAMMVTTQMTLPGTNGEAANLGPGDFLVSLPDGKQIGVPLDEFKLDYAPSSKLGKEVLAQAEVLAAGRAPGSTGIDL